MYKPHRDEEEYNRVIQEINDTRERLRGNRQFLVDTILPSREFHIIAGPSGVGKTTWLLPLIHKWSEGEPVLGFKSNPFPYVYISCDRSLNALDSTLERVGLRDWRIHAYSIEDLDKYLKRYKVPFVDERTGENRLGTHEDLTLAFLPELFNDYMKFDIKVFIVEGYGWFMESPNGNKGAYRDTIRLGSTIRKAYERYGCSLIVTTHVPKMKKGEGYANPRERIIGSVGQAAVASTIILLETGDEGDIHDMNRIVTICPRDSKAITLAYELNNSGGYELCKDQDSTVKERRALSVLDNKLGNEQVGVLLTTAMFEDWAKEYKLSDATMFRWIKNLVELGELQKCGRALYKKVAKVKIAGIE